VLGGGGGGGDEEGMDVGEVPECMARCPEATEAARVIEEGG
jgi:hypothetical protein